jgi:hypothetical protein
MATRGAPWEGEQGEVEQREGTERTTFGWWSLWKTCISLYTLSSFPLTFFFGMAFSATSRMTSAGWAEWLCADVWVVEEETEKTDVAEEDANDTSGREKFHVHWAVDALPIHLLCGPSRLSIQPSQKSIERGRGR